MAEDDSGNGTLSAIARSLLKSPPVAVVFIGSVLVALGALGAVPKFGPFTDHRWGFFVAGFGALIVIAGLWILSRAHHEPSDSAIAKKYGLRILSPQPNSPVPRRIRVEGSFKKIPQKGSLIILEKSPSTNRYWLKKQTPEFDGDKKLWSFTDVYVGGEQGNERVLYVAIVGDSASALVKYYFSVREKFKEPLGIETLPKDIVLCAQVSVRKAESDPTPIKEAAERYGMTIDKPTANSVVGTKIVLKGKYDTKPPEADLVVYERTMDDRMYWFKQEIPDFDERTKHWSVEIYIGNEEGAVRTLHVGTLGESGKALRSYFQAVYDQTGEWVGLREFPPDIKSLVEVSVTYSANARLRTR
jgi:hypothetical protein